MAKEIRLILRIKVPHVQDSIRVFAEVVQRSRPALIYKSTKVIIFIETFKRRYFWSKVVVKHNRKNFTVMCANLHRDTIRPELTIKLIKPWALKKRQPSMQYIFEND